MQNASLIFELRLIMANNTIKSHILGYPRMGQQRELKFALESFWHGDMSSQDLQNTARTLRISHWQK